MSASPTPNPCHGWPRPSRGSNVSCRHKKTGQKAGFSFPEPVLLGSRSSFSGSSRSSFSGSSRSFSSRSGFHRSGSSRSFSSRGFSSGSFSSRSFSGSSSFFFFTASGHGNSQQGSQEDGIFHLISLYLLYKNPHQRSVRDL